jgi:hypothetical protein
MACQGGSTGSKVFARPATTPRARAAETGRKAISQYQYPAEDIWTQLHLHDQHSAPALRESSQQPKGIQNSSPKHTYPSDPESRAAVQAVAYSDSVPADQ